MSICSYIVNVGSFFKTRTFLLKNIQYIYITSYINDYVNS